jgi:hypothetical protein
LITGKWIHDQDRAQRLTHRLRRPRSRRLGRTRAEARADQGAEGQGVVTLTKEQLACQSKFECPVERPADCPDEVKQSKLDKTVKEYLALGSDSAKAQMPEWLEQSYRQECSLDQPTKAKPAPEKPFDPSVIGSSYDGGRDRPLHTT